MNSHERFENSQNREGEGEVAEVDNKVVVEAEVVGEVAVVVEEVEEVEEAAAPSQRAMVVL